MKLQRIRQAVVCVALVIVFLIGLSRFCSLSTNAQQPVAEPYAPGLRNSAVGHPLSVEEMLVVQTQLRQKTGFVQLHFDEAGFLKIENRSHIDGGSALARKLVLAAADSKKSINLQSHNRSLKVSFARLTRGINWANLRTGVQLDAEIIELDFDDFNHLHGDQKAVEAFDPGFALLHELGHAVLELRDSAPRAKTAGDCEAYINGIRRELGIPQRRHYTADLYRRARFQSGLTITVAELTFEEISTSAHTEKHGSSRRFYLRWDAQQVGEARPALRSTDRKRKARAGLAGL